MILKQFMATDEGLRFLINRMELSPRSRAYLMQQPLMTDKALLEKEMDAVEYAYERVSLSQNREHLMQLLHLFSQIHNLLPIWASLESSRVQTEVDLFEIKNFALLSKEAAKALAAMDYVRDPIPSLDAVVELLDPDHTCVSSFYLYPSYSPELAKALELCRRTKGTDDYEHAQVVLEQEKKKVLEALSRRLETFLPALRQAYRMLTYTEIVLSKALLAQTYQGTRPVFLEYGQSPLRVEDMHHPQIGNQLQAQGKAFQRISIALPAGATLLTGANMSGKTVTLKTLGLIQQLAQLGFFVPASKACLPIVDDVVLWVGDKQDLSKGLSSFAAEMLEMDHLFAQVDNGIRILVLADEPVRTTNPKEGGALLCALVDYLNLNKVYSCLSTHYGDLPVMCRKLRVRGFREEKVSGTLDPQKMNDYMDYRLDEDKSAQVPMEALRIAQLLGVQPAFLNRAEKYLKQNEGRI